MLLLTGSSPTTYEVVYRASAEANWTNVEAAGSALSVKLPISKDDTIFGVRSSDAAGRKSLAVNPLPGGR